MCIRDSLNNVSDNGLPESIHDEYRDNVDDIYSYEGPPVKGQIGNIFVFCSASIRDEDYLQD